MKKILLSVAVLLVVGIAVVGATTAIFSDTEVSTGNTFTAGAIDLQVDNDSYYNGEFNEGTSWIQKDLEDDDWFFDFRDLKPGDWGEDTISLHVFNNDSYLCADVTLTSNADNGSTEPELNDEQPWTAGRGELADRVDFIWWADDGDNVLEDDERLLPSGPLGHLGVGETATVALADANVNIWEGSGPLPASSTRYIGKAWCFGNLTLDPVPAGQGVDPTVDAGFDCDGSQEDNHTQTDSLTADISFRAVQSRHNDSFVCVPEQQPRTGVLTVDKVITFSNPQLPPVGIGDFTLHVVGPTGNVSFDSDVTDEVPETGLVPGEYIVTESGPSGFDAEFGLDCSDEGTHGEVVLGAGDNLTCRIINIDERPI